MTDEQEVHYGLFVPGLPPSLNSRLHHMARYRANKTFFDQVRLLAQNLRNAHPGRFPLERAQLLYTLVKPRGKALDEDNAMSVTKPLTDALKGILIVDDSPERVTIRVQQGRGPERGVHLWVVPWSRAGVDEKLVS